MKALKWFWKAAHPYLPLSLLKAFFAFGLYSWQSFYLITYVLDILGSRKFFCSLPILGLWNNRKILNEKVEYCPGGFEWLKNALLSFLVEQTQLVLQL